MDFELMAVAVLSGGGMGFIASSLFSAGRVAELMSDNAVLEGTVRRLLDRLAPLEAAEDRRALQRRQALAKAKEVNAEKRAAKAANLTPITKKARAGR